MHFFINNIKKNIFLKTKPRCNCAVYLKHKRSIVFVDFCSTYNNTSPTSQLYGVQLENNKIGIKAIQPMPICYPITENNENNENIWKHKIPTFLNSFKCAQIQGGSGFDTFVVILTLIKLI